MKEENGKKNDLNLHWRAQTMANSNNIKGKIENCFCLFVLFIQFGYRMTWKMNEQEKTSKDKKKKLHIMVIIDYNNGTNE